VKLHISLRYYLFAYYDGILLLDSLVSFGHRAKTIYNSMDISYY